MGFRLLILLAVLLPWSGHSASPVTLSPVPKNTTRVPGPSFEDFLGSEVCAQCHQREYDAWRQSTHAHAGGLVGEARIIGPFDGTVLQFRDATVTPARDADGGYVFHVERRGRSSETFRVDAVVGGGLMVGGGTQASFAQFPDGSWRFLPFDYSRHSEAWFCSTADRGWLPIDERLSLFDCQDWPLAWPKGFLGIGCQNCHGSQIALKYLPEERRYRTTVKSFGVNCESCHGPGRRHVDIVRSGQHQQVEDIGMEALVLLDKDASLLVCFQCHAKKVTLDNDYLPGDRFEDFYALSAPVLDASLHPDGRVKDFAYQKNHLYSDCYLNGSMTCVDCHAPHSQRYRDINGTELDGRFDNQQCIGCHMSKAAAPEQHSHHRADSPGNLCISCHMPYLQHQGVGHSIEYARSDHTIPIPRPRFDAALGIENACQKCHGDKSLEWQQARVEAWYGDLKPHKTLVTELVEIKAKPDRNRLTALLLGDDGDHPEAYREALGVWIDRYLVPEMQDLEPALMDKLRRLTAHTDIDTRATALLILHVARGHDPAVRALLQDRLLAEAGPGKVALRHRWAGMLWVLGMKHGQRDAPMAKLLLRRAIEIKPDFADAHIGLGDIYQHGDELEKALHHYQQALQHGPSDAPKHARVLFQMAETHRFQDRIDAALAAYTKAITVAADMPSELARYCDVYERVREMSSGDRASPQACGILQR